MTAWKIHFYTEHQNCVVTPNKTQVWFESACKLSMGSVPTERSQINSKNKVTCLRCLNALKKVKNGSRG